MTAAQIITKLVEAEYAKGVEPDARRMIRNERLTLQSAIQRKQGIGAALDEALRVARMWGAAV